MLEEYCIFGYAWHHASSQKQFFALNNGHSPTTCVPY
jgi:hypothetical protein